jgi:formate hydrogenlyase subunit 4
MNAVNLIVAALSAAGALIFLFIGTFFLLFCERFVNARVQHRDGAGRHGQTDFFQVWKDFQKSRRKSSGSILSLPLRIRFASFVWRLLPAIFLLALFGEQYPEGSEQIDLSLLLLLPMIATALEALLVHATADSRERFDRRRRLLLRAMGASALLLSVFAVTLRVGQLNLSAISSFQIHFPYHSFLSSPGLFLCSITAFCSIFLFVTENPVQLQEEQSLNHSMQYVTIFVQKMWVFALICFWVYVFCGGAYGPIVKLLFPFKVAAALLLFTVLQASFPKIRSADSAELTARWLLRLCLVGFFLEAVWVGVRG